MTKSLLLHFLSLLLLYFVSSPSSFFAINNVAVGLVACHPHQIQALTQFKNEFDTRGCNHSDYSNGVWCDNSTGVVTKLRLTGCLSGTLKPNSSLFRLLHLRYLDLSHNNFISSSLPSEFGYLNKLEVLSLSSNGFIGELPSSFSNLSQLSKLDLSQNKLSGSFQLVQNITKLSQLELYDNHFSGTIPSSLHTMPFLSYLDLCGNDLTGSIEVPNSSSMSRLEILYLGNNHFDGKILEPISKFINLKGLDVSFLNTSYPIDLNIFTSLKYLFYLKFSGNSITPASLSSDSYIPLTLERLLLEHCGINEFPNVLKSFQKLEIISLSHNKINGKIPEWFWSLPRLREVSIANNSFTGFEGSAEVLVNSRVQMLSMRKNNFEGALLNLPQSIIVFDAGKNNFTGEIPFSICNKSFLVLLVLSDNNFVGRIPPCLSNLTHVNLRKNTLEGSIPDAFYVGASVRTLDVGYNRLSGKLPRSLLNCSSLEFLSVENNNIKDMFPFWLKALSDLQVIILRSNNFYGHISPPHQGPLGFPELRILDISDNKFIGSLPPSYFLNWKAALLTMNEIGSLYMEYTTNVNDVALYYSYREAIDLKYKGLSMKQKKVLKSYSAIDFSGNRLEGKIPESIGLLNALISLNLSNNAFEGHIPMSLANLTKLESLDLSRNQLSGTIPNGLGTISFLEYINLSHNQLKGEIPQGTQIVGQPKSSFEGNAWLCGLPLQESCFGNSAPLIQHHKQQVEEEDQEEEEEVLSWKAMVIGYVLGVFFGLAISQVIISYKP